MPATSGFNTSLALARRGRARVFTALIGWSLGGACSGGSGGTALVAPSTDPRRNVLVIDEGIDVTAAELRGKVSGAFTLECQDSPPADDGGAATGGGGGTGSGGGGLDDDAGTDAGTDADLDAATDATDDGGDGGPSTFESMKRRYIAELMLPDQSCHVRAGIDPIADPLASVSRFRARWNLMLRNQHYANQVFSEAEWAQLWPALQMEFDAFSYHGTATAGTVAHENPDVRLVVVQRTLGNQAEFNQSFKCIVQDEIDSVVALMSDAEVRDAYLQAPPSQSYLDLQTILADHQVGIVSISFGQPARAALEQLQLSKGCTPLDLRPYFTVLNETGHARTRALGGVNVLEIHSAGNDSAQIDSPADSIECGLGDPLNVLVGSYDLTQTRSTFSNFGACVPVAAPGEEIITSYAGGWLVPVFGTSFSAPLLARLVSRTAEAPYDPARALQALLARRDPVGNIPIGTFPSDFFYAPGGGISSTRGALATTMPLPAAAKSWHGLGWPARSDLREVLAPLLRLRKISRPGRDTRAR